MRFKLFYRNTGTPHWQSSLEDEVDRWLTAHGSQVEIVSQQMAFSPGGNVLLTVFFRGGT